MGPDLLLGGQKQATRQEIIAGLPSKAEADILVDKYYKFVDMAPSKSLNNDRFSFLIGDSSHA